MTYINDHYLKLTAGYLFPEIGRRVDKFCKEDPSANVIRLGERFVPLRDAWKKRGFDLDLGIGIAQGYSTLGAIGYEGRWDYACIGSVTNLAARLCSEAKGGQILANRKTLARVEDVVQNEALGEVTLKRIAQPVPVFNVTGLKA